MTKPESKQDNEADTLNRDHLADTAKSKCPIDFVDLEIEGIDASDYPDFVDAYVYTATAVLPDGSTRDATDAECEALTEDRRDWINEYCCIRAMGG